MHVACMGEKRNAYRLVVGKPERKNNWYNLGLYGMIILKWLLKKSGKRTRT